MQIPTFPVNVELGPDFAQVYEGLFFSFKRAMHIIFAVKTQYLCKLERFSAQTIKISLKLSPLCYVFKNASIGVPNRI